MQQTFLNLFHLNTEMGQICQQKHIGNNNERARIVFCHKIHQRLSAPKGGKRRDCHHDAPWKCMDQDAALTIWNARHYEYVHGLVDSM